MLLSVTLNPFVSVIRPTCAQYSVALSSVLLLVGNIQPAVAEVAAEQAGGVKRALLIGINRYKSVPALQGSVNDVETMREILTTRWGLCCATSRS